MRIRNGCWLVSLALLFSGCGGGSSGTTTPPPPPAAPTVTAVTPTNASTGVAIASTVTATFSEAMTASTITSSTFTLTPQGGSAIVATVAYSSSNNVATLTPNASLAYNTMYTATITTGVTSSLGAALAANYTWTFVTATAPVPTVTAVTPTNASTGVAIASTVTATFSMAMNASTFTGSTFTLMPQGGSNSVAATVSYSSTSNTATLTPNAPLAYNTAYTATVTTGVTSSLGVALAANYTWTFTTATAPPPAVIAVTPTNASTGVAIASAVTATFNQVMNASTITGSTFTLVPQGGSAVQGSVSYNSSVATLTPSQNLAYSTTYTATVTTGVSSVAGAALSSNYVWTFTTVAAPVPTVTSTTPASGATNVTVGNALTATFSQPMNASTITASTFTLTGPGNTAVPGLVSYNSGTSTATFTPNAALAFSTSYTATIATGATSAAGAALASPYTWSFTTSASPNQVTVDFGTTYQTIRGFGGASVWLGQMPAAVAEALFSPTNGLGLSILRVRIDPTGSSTSNPPWVTTNSTGWSAEAANGTEAVANNPNAIVFASPWTAPSAWKLNGSSAVSADGATWNESFNSCGEGTGYCGGYLDPNHYADYANYLEDFVHYFNTTAGFNLYAISMQNEPEENVTYESCVWTPDQMDTWVANNATTITSDPYSTKLIMPESDTFNPLDASKTLNDPAAQGLVSIIGGHLYGVQPSPYSIPAADSPKELWMTEFGPLSSASLTWPQALTTYGESIHNSMVNGQYNAYVWWGAFGQSTGSCATAAGTCGFVDHSGNVMPMGYVMGQYSKFIQPGYTRVSATANPQSGVYVSAYTGTASGTQHYVIVAINANSSSASLSFTLNNGTVTSVTPYQSTSAAGLAAQSAVSVSAGQFNYTLPAQSIVTFVQ